MQGFFVLKPGLKLYANKMFESSLNDGVFKSVFTIDMPSAGRLITLKINERQQIKAKDDARFLLQVEEDKGR